MSPDRIPLPMFRTILFAADFSTRSHEAFEVACSLANEKATRLIVLSVLEPPGGAIESEEDYATVREEEFGLETLLRLLQDHYAPSRAIPVQYRIREGHAAEEILRGADLLGADLIVMGTHGRRGLDRLLTGSVAEAVLRKARCPVVTVRSTPHAHSLSEADRPAGAWA